jgi:putative Mn2+ efflux pump MntP
MQIAQKQILITQKFFPQKKRYIWHWLCPLTILRQGLVLLLQYSLSANNCMSLVLNTAAVGFGHFLGEKLTQKSKADFSWIGGVMLVILAITKLK